MWEQGESLENKADVAVFRGIFINASVADVDFAAVRLNKSRDEPKQSGFSASAWTKQRKIFLVMYG
jgi:hypothetical protein